jgi:triacylglycerol lipase
MALTIHRTVFRRRACCSFLIAKQQLAPFHHSTVRYRDHSAHDPRLAEVGDIIHDQFAVLESEYKAPRNPIILAHGLLGFDELHVAGWMLPGIRYWYGITEALAAKGVEVITATVPPSGSIEKRAAKLADDIGRNAHGKAVNIIAYVSLHGPSSHC